MFAKWAQSSKMETWQEYIADYITGFPGMFKNTARVLTVTKQLQILVNICDLELQRNDKVVHEGWKNVM